MENPLGPFPLLRLAFFDIRVVKHDSFPKLPNGSLAPHHSVGDLGAITARKHVLLADGAQGAV